MIRRFLRNEEGSIFIVVALATMAVVGAVGVAVDIARGQMVQAKLQNAVDAAGLAAGASVNATNIGDIATKYATINFAQGNLGATLNPISTTLSSDKKLVTITASADLPTTITRIFNQSNITVNASTEITRSNKGLEVAMVLDTTGSMAGSKIVALKNAAHSLVNVLFGTEAVATNLWIGLVPFSQSVNVGASHSDWLDQTYFNALPWETKSWGGCTEARYTSARDITDDPPFDLNFPNAEPPAAPYEKFKAYFNGTWSAALPVNICSNSSSCRCSNYGPCGTDIKTSVTTRYRVTCANNNCSRTDYTLTAGSNPSNGCIGTPVTPLTNVKSTITSGINALVAAGMTHVNHGAVWGWRMISPRWRGYWGGAMNTNNLPLDYNAPLMSKAVIIMTDGENTSTTYSAYPSASGVTPAVMDTKLTRVCNSMKAQGVIVYTILFQQNSNNIKTLLRNCATTPDYFFDSPSAQDLQTAFTTIADSLSNLRISK